MATTMKTGEQFMDAVAAMKKTLLARPGEIDRNNDLMVAAMHNIRRKKKMIRAVKAWFVYLKGNGPRPRISAADAFNPSEGSDRTNIYYIFKEMKTCMPWELDRNIMLEPTAYTLAMLEITESCFPCSEIFALRMTQQGFINRWTLPKNRPEWTDKERAYEEDRYRKDLADFEKELTNNYMALSNYFEKLENPDAEPTRKKIEQTHTTVKKIAKKVGVKNEYSGKVARDMALSIWEKAQHDSRVIALCGNRKPSFANVFAIFKDRLIELRYTTVAKFRNAVKNAQKVD